MDNHRAMVDVGATAGTIPLFVATIFTGGAIQQGRLDHQGGRRDGGFARIAVHREEIGTEARQEIVLRFALRAGAEGNHFRGAANMMLTVLAVLAGSMLVLAARVMRRSAARFVLSPSK